MRQRLEILLTILAGACIFAIAATDPWWWDNWLRIVIVALIVICAATVGFLTGVNHGMQQYSKKLQDKVTWL